jgi:imidazolonepropionase
VWDAIWTGARLATMAGGGLGLVEEEGAIAVRGDRIAFAGPAAALHDAPAALARTVHDAAGRWVLPGFVDPHTHLIWGGDRIAEFEAQLAGATRRELAAAGGGILATMRATRAADEDALVAGAAARLRPMMAQGVTTVEIKSGYGLDRETELRMLRAARRLGRELPVRVVTSFLGAHALPPEFAGRPHAFTAFLADEVLPAAVEEGLVDLCDGGLERLSIPDDAMLALYRAAQARGLPIRGHTDQYADVDGAGALASLGALSADHLEHVSEGSVAAMASSGTVAVLLPGSNLFLAEPRRPPVESFRRHRVPMALASNLNPGSSPVRSPLLALALGCSLFRMTVAEALRGLTVEAARAVGLAGEVGELRAGLAADFVLWDIGTPAELCYWLGGAPDCRVVQGGTVR